MVNNMALAHSPAEPNFGGVIDLAHLAAQTLGDPGLQEEVLRLYSDMSAVYLERIETSTTVSDLVLHLHTLRSAAAGIGALRVSELAGLAEERLRGGAPVNPEWITEIARAVAECRAQIDGMVDATA